MLFLFWVIKHIFLFEFKCKFYCVLRIFEMGEFTPFLLKTIKKNICS
jgi:hypothetical protein